MAIDDKSNEACSSADGLGGWRWFVVYAVLALVVQWPLVGKLLTHISYGHEREITVPLLNLWTVWWNADRAAHWFHGYWDAPIFFPTKKTFLFSEIQPTSLIVAPVYWLTGNRGLSYNVYQLLILALNGYSAHRLSRRIGQLPWLAFCCGVMSLMLPFIIWQFGVVQLTTLFGINWTVHALLDLFGTAFPSDPADDASGDANPKSELTKGLAAKNRFHFPVGVRLGFAYGITYWLCNYWGLFLTLLLVPCSVWFWNRCLVSRFFWRQLLWATLISVVMIGPIAVMQRSLSRDHDWKSARSSELIHDLSARWRDYTDVPWRNLAPWLEFPELSRASIWPLGGGGLKLLLAPVGLIAALMSKRRRRWGAFAATFALIAFGLSLGPTVRFSARIPILGGLCLYEQLLHVVPGLALIRSPFRFCFFVQIAMVWLSIEALDLLSPLRWLTSPVDEWSVQGRRLPSFFNPLFGIRPDESLSVRAILPLVAISALVTLEAVPPTTLLYELPSRSGLPIWVQWLRDNTDPDQPIACLPFPLENNVSDYEESAVWMYWSTFHRRTLANGYSGFFPANYWALKDGLALYQRPAGTDPEAVYEPKFSHYTWDNPGLKRLNESSVRYVVVRRSFGTQNDVWSHSATRFRWALVVSDEVAQIDIYKLPVLDE